MNLKIRQFKVDIESYIKTTDLPPEVKRLVVKEIYDKIADEADKAVFAEKNEADAMEREKICKAAEESAQNAVAIAVNGIMEVD